MNPKVPLSDRKIVQPRPAQRVSLERRYEDLTDRHEPLVCGGYRAKAYLGDVAEMLGDPASFEMATFSELRFE